MLVLLNGFELVQSILRLIVEVLILVLRSVDHVLRYGSKDFDDSGKLIVFRVPRKDWDAQEQLCTDAS